jgi:G3E family GTPase
MEAEMTKIDIISGFLGAGKTTLIKKLLSEAFKGQKVVLIENEFGEIGIDGGFLKTAGIEIKELNSGCICCSLVGDFGTALKELVDKYNPDRILIEPSGVGKLTDVINAVNKAAANCPIVLNSYTAVVDCTKVKMYMKNFGEFFNNQIDCAKTIILSRSQKMTDEKLKDIVNDIKERNSNATVVTTSWDELTGEQLLAAIEKKNSMEQELLAEQLKLHAHEGHHHHHHHDDDEEEDEHECCHHHHDDDDDDEDEDGHECCHHHHDDDDDEDDEHECCHHHHGEHDDDHDADEIFSSIGIETPNRFNRAKLEDALKRLSSTDEFGNILRAKGIVADDTGKWAEFDLTPDEYEIRNGVPDVTGRLCVIGSNLKKKDIKALFGC